MYLEQYQNDKEKLGGSGQDGLAALVKCAVEFSKMKVCFGVVGVVLFVYLLIYFSFRNSLGGMSLLLLRKYQGTIKKNKNTFEHISSCWFLSRVVMRILTTASVFLSCFLALCWK